MTKELKDMQELVEKLGLLPHPEGGFYKETYRCAHVLDTPRGTRSAATLIYFLIGTGNFSRFHRIAFEEIWLFHAGSPLRVHMIDDSGQLKTVHVGLDPGCSPQIRIPAGVIFGSETSGTYSLVSCMVAPGFDFRDFELFNKAQMLAQFPQHEQIINHLHQNES
jgi:predicted cupin superfamily sugar epimerase